MLYIIFLLSGFPYYAIEDREHLYTAGSVIYGLYFIVSFPMFYRIDENTGHVEQVHQKHGNAKYIDRICDCTRTWSLEKTLTDSLAACMLVTILLEMWRLGFCSSPSTKPTLPWLAGKW